MSKMIRYERRKRTNITSLDCWLERLQKYSAKKRSLGPDGAFLTQENADKLINEYRV